MKSNVFVFHGTGGYPEENWFPWLKDKLEQKGYKVFIPQFPTPKDQSIQSWLGVLKTYEKYINEDTILIGHSLGGLFLLRVLEGLAQPMKAAFFVSAPIGIKPIANYDSDNDFSGFSFNWPDIKTKAENFTVYHSDNDPYISLENGKQLSKELGIELTFIPNAGHFNTKAGYTTFEDLLEKIDGVATR